MANCSILSIKDLEGCTLIIQNAGHALNSLINSFFLKANVKPGLILEVNDPETLPLQVSEEFGISFIPACIASSKENTRRISDVKAIPVFDDYCFREVYLTEARKSTSSLACDRFKKYLIKYGNFIQSSGRIPSADKMFPNIK